jgi:hypothetical protein
VLKKTGIAVAAAAVGLVALAPFAMADEADRSPECDQSATNVQSFDTEAGDIDGDGVVLGSVGGDLTTITSGDSIDIAGCSNVERLLNVEEAGADAAGEDDGFPFGDLLELLLPGDPDDPIVNS